MKHAISYFAAALSVAISSGTAGAMVSSHLKTFIPSDFLIELALQNHTIPFNSDRLDMFRRL